MTQKHPFKALVVKAPIMEKVRLPWTKGDTSELGVKYAMQLLDKHLLGVYE